jgi:hypothetical protein
VSAQLDLNRNIDELIFSSSCCTCQAAIAGQSFFCRWCGAQQPESRLINEPTSGLKNYTALLSEPSPFSTMPLEPKTGDLLDEVGKKEANLRISGYLIQSFVNSVKLTTSHFQGGFEKAALAMLTFIPVCLLIIFLSPLDAYFATKNFLKG